jgi:choline dehydrogenase-like flavoprotein
MTIDAVSAIPRGTELQTDVCIVGGGPAGITVALQLGENTNLNVVLLESGWLEAGERDQKLNDGDIVGLDYYDLDVTRLRVLGGSSHKWAGWCRPMDEIDFDGRPWVGNHGWPISYEEMQPYFRGAATLTQLESQRWTPTPDMSLSPLYRRPYVDADVEIALWQGSPPTRFGVAYRQRLQASSQVQVILGATATNVLEQGGRATGVEVASLNGNELTVSAGVVVLAAGALETARLLLASNRSNPAGLANENDLVGRYFMEHPHLVTGRIELYPDGTSGRAHLAAVDNGFSGIRARLSMQRPHGAMKAAYVISRKGQEREELLNFSTHLRTVSLVSREESDAYQAFKLAIGNLRSPGRMLRQIRDKAIPEDAGDLVKRLIKGAPEIMQVVYREALRKPTELALYTQCEQTPRPDSRVTVDRSRLDALGMPRIQLDWKLSRVDKESVIKSQEIVGTQLHRAGLGRLVPEPVFADDSDDWGPNLRGGHHHLGMARMSTSPRTGVVNTDGRAHTVRDLYIADSSVFPTGGYANPLLTVVAWALRLADHIGHEYRGQPVDLGPHDPSGMPDEPSTRGNQ